MVTTTEQFTELAAGFSGRPGVTPPAGGRAFGDAALKADGKIFAMLTRGQLVVKLPKARVADLVAAGEGEYFTAGKGRPMKEWFVLARSSTLAWQPLAEEALQFVSGRQDSNG